MRSEIPPTHQIPTTPIQTIRATAADDDGILKSETQRT